MHKTESRSAGRPTVQKRGEMEQHESIVLSERRGAQARGAKRSLVSHQATSAWV